MHLPVLLVVGCFLGLATGREAPDMYGIINILYMKADPNMDGKISQDNLASIYMGLDADGSGDVSRKEFVAGWTSLTLQSDELASAYFDMADIDHNGVIDSNDTKVTFKEFDTNYDGYVSDDEFVTRYKQLYKVAPFVVLYRRLQARENIKGHINKGQFQQLFMGLKGQDGVSIDKATLEAKWVAEGFGTKEDADEVMKSIDQDGDGVISKEELGYRFEWLDTGIDATISVDDMQEILSYHEPGVNDSVLIKDTPEYRMRMFSKQFGGKS